MLNFQLNKTKLYSSKRMVRWLPGLFAAGSDLVSHSIPLNVPAHGLVGLGTQVIGQHRMGTRDLEGIADGPQPRGR